MTATVGILQEIEGSGKAGPGFVLHVNKKPVASFIFDNWSDAELAAKKMSEIIAAATTVAA